MITKISEFQKIHEAKLSPELQKKKKEELESLVTDFINKCTKIFSNIADVKKKNKIHKAVVKILNFIDPSRGTQHTPEEISAFSEKIYKTWDDDDKSNIYKILDAFAKMQKKVRPIIKKYAALVKNESTIVDDFSDEESKCISAFINKALKELSGIDEGKVNEDIDENSDKSPEEVLGILKSKYPAIQEIIHKCFNMIEFWDDTFTSFDEVSDSDALEYIKTKVYDSGNGIERVTFGLKCTLWDIDVDDIAKFKSELTKYKLDFYRILVNAGEYEDADGNASVGLVISMDIDDILKT